MPFILGHRIALQSVCETVAIIGRVPQKAQPESAVLSRKVIHHAAHHGIRRTRIDDIPVKDGDTITL